MSARRDWSKRHKAACDYESGRCVCTMDLEPFTDTAVAACRMLLEASAAKDIDMLTYAVVLARLAVNRMQGLPDDHGMDEVRI